jgi:hypothetical protein
MDPSNSPSVAEDDNCTFSYDTPGTASLSIEVIDSVLYSSDSNTLQITIAPSVSTINGQVSTNFTNTTTHYSAVYVSWTQNSSDTYTCTFNNVKATATATNSCTSVSYPPNTTVNLDISDNSGNQTDYTDSLTTPSH